MAPAAEAITTHGDDSNHASSCFNHGMCESVQELASLGIQEVPAHFLQPPDLQPQLILPHDDDQCNNNSIPVIDMADFQGDNRSAAIAKLARACEEWGFFQVINHKVSNDTMEEMKKVGREFFELPIEIKRKWAMKEGDIMGYGRFNTGNQDVTDWVDLLAHFVAPEHSKNYEFIPTDPPNYRGVVTRYTEEMKSFIYLLCGFISESLGLEHDYIKKTSGEFSAALRLNYYAPCPNPNQVLGVGSHSDGGTLTVLIEDGCTNGLQVFKDGQWITIRTINPDALIVNVADMLQLISNGKYASVNHRAVVNGCKERYSTVLFFYPELSPNIVVRPAPKLLSQSNPARYCEITYVDYLSFYLHQRQPGKARIDSLKIDVIHGNNVS